MPTSVSRLSWVASNAKQALDDVHELADLPFAGQMLLAFADLSITYAWGRQLDAQALRASNQILTSLGKEFIALLQALHPTTTEGTAMDQSPAIIRVLQAAYLAQGAVERIHDLTSLDTAGHAVLNYSLVLAETSRADLTEARAIDPEAPGVDTLWHRYLSSNAGLALACVS